MILAYRATIPAVGYLQLPQGKPLNEVEFSAPVANTGDVFLTDSPSNIGTSSQFAIPAGRRFPFQVTELSDLWLSGAIGDSLDLLAQLNKDSS